MNTANTVLNTTTDFIGQYEIRATKKREYIDQFKVLLKDLYASDPRMKGFREDSTTDDLHYKDPDNHVLLALHGDKVIGGICVRISTPEFPVRLDLENDILPENGQSEFHLQDLFPNLDLKNYAYAECNRVVLHPDYRDGELLKRLLIAPRDLCERYHVRYIFAFSDLVRLRTYRRAFKSMDEEVEICDADFSLRYNPEGLKMRMLYGEFRAFREARQIAENQQTAAA